MMDYELFKKLICQRIKEFLPPVYHSWEPVINRVNKVNECRDAFCLVPEDKERVAVPTVYLNDLYRDFLNDEDLDRVLGITASVIMQWSGKYAVDDFVMDFKRMRRHVVINLISADLNQELLGNLPHLHVMDLAVVFRVIMGMGPDGINSILMTRELMKDMEIEEEELFSLAVENSRRLFPAKLIPSQGSFFVVTNESDINGASVMLYREEMQKLGETLGGDYYILPSSIHEFFAIPAEEGNAMLLRRLLREGNREIVGREDLLSESIYYYSRDTETLTRCGARAADIRES